MTLSAILAFLAMLPVVLIAGFFVMVALIAMTAQNPKMAIAVCIFSIGFTYFLLRL